MNHAHSTAARATRPAEQVAELSLLTSLRSELIKFRSLRSLVWLTIVGAVTHAALGPIQALGLVVAEGQSGNITNLDGAMSLVLGGMGSACILFGIAGVLTVTSEYPHMAIRGTFTAVPRRGYVVVGKLVSYAIVAVVAAFLGSVVALAGAVPSLNSYGFHVDVFSVDVIRVLAAASLYLVVWGCYGQILGWLLRSTIGATMALLALFFVVPSLMGLVPRPAAEAIYPLLPSEVAMAMVRLSSDPTTVSPAAGLALTVAYLLCGTGLITKWVAARDA